MFSVPNHVTPRRRLQTHILCTGSNIKKNNSNGRGGGGGRRWRHIQETHFFLLLLLNFVLLRCGRRWFLHAISIRSNADLGSRFVCVCVCCTKFSFPPFFRLFRRRFRSEQAHSHSRPWLNAVVGQSVAAM